MITAARIGFIGLGVMGRPMAANLIAAGYELTLHTRTASRAAELVDAGARLAADAAEVATRSEIVITMLRDTSDVDAVLCGPGGILAGDVAGKLWIDMSSISPVAAREFAATASAAGMRCLDAPVSGGEQGAIDAKLTIMAGGPDAVFAEAQTILARLGATIVRVGDSGAGQVAKACNQMIVGVTIGVVAEALALGARAGVDPAAIREALLGGFAQSRILEVHGQRMLDGAFTPGFRLGLHRKDLRIAADTADALSLDVPLTDAVTGLVDAVIADHDEGLDHAALLLAYQPEGRLNWQAG